MRHQPFDFTGGSGDRLSGQIDVPDRPPQGYALFAPCFTCGKQSLAATRIGRALAEHGIATLRFDFTGLGESEGSFGTAGFSSDVADAIAAAKAMTDANMAPSLLIGHSLGGAAVLAAAHAVPLAAVATINAPFNVDHVKTHFGASWDEILEKGQAEVTLGGRTFTVRRSFIEDLAKHDLGAAIHGLHRPLLILHGPTDEVVGIDNASSIFITARHPKSFVALDGADHLLSDRRDTDFAAAMIAAWASRYLPAVAQPQEAGPAAPTAMLTGEGKYQTRVRLRGREIISDEPREVGGLGTGPTPYEMLGAGLATCTAMTLNLYTQLKGWELPLFEVEVTHKDGSPNVFTRKISFLQPVDAERKAKLLAIAEKCPVHRTLEQGSRIETVAADAVVEPEPAVAHIEDMKAACED